MAAPRCWGYEDDGTFNGKCRKTAAQCRFAHPDSQDWKIARRLSNVKNTRSDDGWGKQNPNAGWGTSWEKAGAQTDKSWSDAGGWSSGWSNSASGWGSGSWPGETSTPDTKGKGKQREQQDVPMREPSPPRKTLPAPLHTQPSAKSDTPSSDLESRKPSNLPVPRPSLPNRNISGKEYDFTKLRKSSTPTVHRPSIPAPNPSKQRHDETPVPSDLKAGYKELVASNKIRSKSSSPYPSKYMGTEGRAALYTDILTCMQDVVIAQIVQQEAENNYAGWKKYHDSSPIYSHASLGTRKILEGIRNDYFKQLTDAKQKRDAALDKLAGLPDFLPRKPINDPAITKEMVMKYTDELRSWFQALKIHERLAVEKKEKELKAKTLDYQSGPRAEGQTNTPQPLTAEELLNRGNWDWSELKAALKMAEANVNMATEQVYSSIWTNHNIIDENIRRLPDVNQPMEDVLSAQSRSEDYETLETKMKSLGQSLAVQAEQAATTFTRVHNLQHEVNNLRAESTEINRLCDVAEQQFIEFEKAKNEMQEETESLKAQLEVLHQHQWSSPRPSSDLLNASVQPILDELLPHFQKRMEDDLRLIFNLLQRRGLENQEEVRRQVNEMLKPLLSMTDEIEDICHTFMAMAMTQDSALPTTATSSTTAR